MESGYESKLEKLKIFCDQMEQRHNDMLKTEDKIEKMRMEQSQQQSRLEQLIEKLKSQGKEAGHLERDKKLQEYNQIMELLEREIVSQKSEQTDKMTQLEADIQSNIRNLSAIEMKLKGYRLPAAQPPVETDEPKIDCERMLSELRNTLQNKQMRLKQIKLQNSSSSNSSPTKSPPRRSNSLHEAQIRQAGLKLKAYSAHAESIRVKKQHQYEQNLLTLNHQIATLQNKLPTKQFQYLLSSDKPNEQLSHLRSYMATVNEEFAQLSKQNQENRVKMLQMYEQIRNIEQLAQQSNNQQSRMPQLEIQIAHLRQQTHYTNQEKQEVEQQNARILQDIHSAQFSKAQLEASATGNLKAQETEQQIGRLQSDIDGIKQMIVKAEEQGKSMVEADEVEKVKQDIESAKEVMKEKPVLVAENERLEKEIRVRMKEEAEHPPIIDRLLEERLNVDQKTEQLLKLTEQCEQMELRVQELRSHYNIEDELSLEQMFSESFFQEPKKNGKWAQTLLYLFILVNFWLLVPRLLS